MLTPDQKKRLGPQLLKTLGILEADFYTLPDFKGTTDEIVELVCDAGFPVDYGGMTKEDYDALCNEYGDTDTERWLRELLRP